MNGIMEIRRQVRLSQWSAMVRREAAVEQVRSEATQPELVQFTPPAEYAVGQAQSIVIKTIDTTIEIPVNTQPDVVAAAVSFLRQS